jgi:SAM-dependent methyltransferase
MPDKTNQQIDWAADSRSFDRVAEVYEAYRPEYPPELVDSVISMAGLQPDSRLLEIGSGTGKATRLFAQRGFAIHCLEPGQNLAAVAAQKLKPYPQVTFEAARFEAWPESQSSFDLVFSAQAFHWVPKDIGYAKAARLLKEKRYIALFWNMYPPLTGDIEPELAKVYQEQAPEMVRPNTYVEELIQARELELRDSGYFEHLEVKKFPWSARYDTRRYLGLLNTYSDHLRLTEERRAGLFAGLAEVIDRHGGYIERPYLAILYLAQKRSKEV